MELLWYGIVLFMLGMYMVLDGFDFGAGIVHLFFARSEEDKRAIINAIGPFWDANEVWLIAGGGVLFFAFPTLYASSFSGFYLPLIIILWLLIFRAIGLELRGFVDNELWRTIWDKAFGLSSLLLALFFGTAVGNIARGVNMGCVEDGQVLCAPHHFFLPLWNPTFDPRAEHLGVLDWFTVLIGLIGVVSLFIHGANWIVFKTGVSVKERLKLWAWRMNFALAALVLLTLALWHLIHPHPLKNFLDHPWLWVFPALTFFALGALFRLRSFRSERTAFLFSSLFLLSSFASTALAIYPAWIPSTNELVPSLTIRNTAAHPYGLQAGLGWFVVAIALVGVYFVVQHRIFSGKLDDSGYGAH